MVPCIILSLILSFSFSQIIDPDDPERERKPKACVPPLIVGDFSNHYRTLQKYKNHLGFDQRPSRRMKMKVTDSNRLVLRAESESDYWWSALTTQDNCVDLSNYSTYVLKVRAPPGSKFLIEIQGSDPRCRNNPQLRSQLWSTDYVTFSEKYYWVGSACDFSSYNGYLPATSKAAIRCCSDDSECIYPGQTCLGLSTHIEASKICSDNEMRLCSREELQNCAKNECCNNNMSVWTNEMQGEEVQIRIPLNHFPRTRVSFERLWAISLVQLTPDVDFLFDYFVFLSCEHHHNDVPALKLGKPQSYCSQTVFLSAGVEYILSSIIRMYGTIIGSIALGDQSEAFCIEKYNNPWCILPNKNLYKKNISVVSNSYTFEYVTFIPIQNENTSIKLVFNDSSPVTKNRTQSVFFANLILHKAKTENNEVPKNLLINANFSIKNQTLRGWTCHGSRETHDITPTYFPTYSPTYSPTESLAPTHPPTPFPTPSPTIQLVVIVKNKKINHTNILIVSVSLICVIIVLLTYFWFQKLRTTPHSVPLLPRPDDEPPEPRITVANDNGISTLVPVTFGKEA